MERFSSPGSFDHASPPRTAVLLVQLGTPTAPTAAALRPFLRQFLGDPRVVEIPRLIWWPILNLIILNTRPKKSAAKYAMIWTPEGSPLRVYTERQAKLLAVYLGERVKSPLSVDYAMRYGKPSIEERIQAMVAEGCDRILVMYAGKIVEEVSSGALADAKHPYTRGLLNCLPRLGEGRHPLPTLDRQPEWAL